MTEIFKLSKLQSDRVDVITRDISYWAPDDILSAGICDSFKDSHNVLFVKFWDGDYYSVRDLNGVEIIGEELDLKLCQMLEETHGIKAKIERLKESDEIKSVTTSFKRYANSDLIDKILKSEVKLNLEQKKTQQNYAMSFGFDCLEQCKTEEEKQEFFFFVNKLYTFCLEQKKEFDTNNNKKRGSKILGAHVDAEAGVTGKKKKTKKGKIEVRKSSVAKILCSPEIAAEMKKYKMDPTDQEWVDEYMRIKNSPKSKKIEANIVSSTTTSYGSQSDNNSKNNS